MIKFSGNDRATGRPVIGIGLSRENCEALLGGAPIVFNTENMPGLPVMDVCLFAGESDRDNARQFIEAGLIRPDQVFEDKGGEN